MQVDDIVARFGIKVLNYIDNDKSHLEFLKRLSTDFESFYLKTKKDLENLKESTIKSIHYAGTILDEYNKKTNENKQDFEKENKTLKEIYDNKVKLILENYEVNKDITYTSNSDILKKIDNEKDLKDENILNYEDNLNNEILKLNRNLKPINDRYNQSISKFNNETLEDINKNHGAISKELFTYLESSHHLSEVYQRQKEDLMGDLQRIQNYIKNYEENLDEEIKKLDMSFNIEVKKINDEASLKKNHNSIQANLEIDFYTNELKKITERYQRWRQAQNKILQDELTECDKQIDVIEHNFKLNIFKLKSDFLINLEKQEKKYEMTLLGNSKRIASKNKIDKKKAQFENMIAKRNLNNWILEGRNKIKKARKDYLIELEIIKSKKYIADLDKTNSRNLLNIEELQAKYKYTEDKRILTTNLERYNQILDNEASISVNKERIKIDNRKLQLNVNNKNAEINLKRQISNIEYSLYEVEANLKMVNTLTLMNSEKSNKEDYEYKRAREIVGVLNIEKNKNLKDFNNGNISYEINLKKEYYNHLKRVENYQFENFFSLENNKIEFNKANLSNLKKLTDLNCLREKEIYESANDINQSKLEYYNSYAKQILRTKKITSDTNILKEGLNLLSSIIKQSNLIFQNSLQAFLGYIIQNKPEIKTIKELYSSLLNDILLFYNDLFNEYMKWEDKQVDSRVNFESGQKYDLLISNLKNTNEKQVSILRQTKDSLLETLNNYKLTLEKHKSEKDDTIKKYMSLKSIYFTEKSSDKRKMFNDQILNLQNKLKELNKNIVLNNKAIKRCTRHLNSIEPRIKKLKKKYNNSFFSLNQNKLQESSFIVRFHNENIEIYNDLIHKINQMKESINEDLDVNMKDISKNIRQVTRFISSLNKNYVNEFLLNLSNFSNESINNVKSFSYRNQITYNKQKEISKYTSSKALKNYKNKVIDLKDELDRISLNNIKIKNQITKKYDDLIKDEENLYDKNKDKLYLENEKRTRLYANIFEACDLNIKSAINKFHNIKFNLDYSINLNTKNITLEAEKDKTKAKEETKAMLDYYQNEQLNVPKYQKQETAKLYSDYRLKNNAIKNENLSLNEAIKNEEKALSTNLVAFNKDCQQKIQDENENHKKLKDDINLKLKLEIENINKR